MPRILPIVQDKGGSGKSVVVRALAEAVPDAAVIEIDASMRLLELGERVRFFPTRADRAAIERTGGQAARAEFDPVVDALAAVRQPTIVDVGANTATSLLTLLGELAPDLKAAGVELGVLVVATAEPGALAEVPRVMALAKPWAAARFLVENQLRGPVDPKVLARLADKANMTCLAEQVMEPKAVEILAAGGFASVPRLDPAKLNTQHGLALGSRIRRDLTRFRAEAMRAVEPAASWLVG